MSDVQILEGECRVMLATLPSESVHCIVTSPPYWGLRDYGVPGQLGLEPTPEDYIAAMVGVFRELRRVLRSDGTCWLNMGDCYATGAGKVGEHPGGGERGARWAGRGAHSEENSGKAGYRLAAMGPMTQPNRMPQAGLKPKDLVMMPHRLALALQADGWWVRSDIVWAKPNPMPESVQDRPTRAHEYLFLLTKSERYYYDSVAIAEPSSTGRLYPTWQDRKAAGAPVRRGDPRISLDRGQWSGEGGDGVSRNKRDVWTVLVEAFPGAHFATFPPALIEPCILAGTSERGCCPACGAPWRRMTEKPAATPADEYAGKWRGQGHQAAARKMLANTRARRLAGGRHDNPYPAAQTIGWEPSCACGARAPVPCTVLDCFAGSGTTGRVAVKHNRNAVLIELNPEYCRLIEKRLSGVQRTLPLDAGALPLEEAI